MLGNLFRDQLDRYGELELIGDRWRSLVAGSPARHGRRPTTPTTRWSPALGVGRTQGFGFGIEDASVSRESMQHAADSKWCASCGHRLGYDAVFLGHLGHWSCPDCGRARPAPDVAARRCARWRSRPAVHAGAPPASAAVRLPVPGLYNVYNALAAAASGLRRSASPTATVAAGLERFSAAFGRFERLAWAVVDGAVLLVKNPAGANEVIRTLAADARTASRCRRAERPHRRRPRRLVDLGRRLRGAGWPRSRRSSSRGTRAAEMAMRLKYAGRRARRSASSRRRRLALALDRALARGEGPVYLLGTYTAMLELRAVLVDRGVVRPYWEAA